VSTGTEKKKFEERERLIKDAKELCCEITGVADFAFINKIQLALIVRNLVLDFHKKKEMLDTALAKVNELEGKDKPENTEGGK